MPATFPRTKSWPRKRELFDQSQICHWCERLLVLDVVAGRDDPGQFASATLDHVKCRMECTSQEEWDSPENTVLACSDCNNRRNHEYHIARKIFRTTGWTPTSEPPAPTGPRAEQIADLLSKRIPAPTPGELTALQRKYSKIVNH